MKTTLEPDCQEAIRFMEFWREVTGMSHITLTAITPDGPATTDTFNGVDTENALRFITRAQDAGRNVYFEVNETTQTCKKKPSKALMVAVVCRHADIDPDDTNHAYQQERERLQKLADFLRADSAMPPTAILDSGNGIQPLWVVQRETLSEEAIQRAEEENRRIESALGAAGTHNVDRLLRLPGTLNFPNAKKLRLGRGVSQARVLHTAPVAYLAATAERIGNYWAERLANTDLVRPPAKCSAGQQNGNATAKPRDRKKTQPKDLTRSAIAFSKGADLRRSVKSFEQFVQAMLEDPVTADWAQEKGIQFNNRELRRIWDKTAPGPSWLENAQRNMYGEPRANLYNVMLALREDPRISRIVAYDEFARTTTLMHPVPGKIFQNADASFTPREIHDDDVSAIQEFLQANGLQNISRDVVQQAANQRARERSFHPVRDYLNTLRWDGTPRLASWLHTYLGAENTEYHASIGSMFLVAAVARIYEPSCQCDYMSVFEGPQGLLKSSALKRLADPWFSDAIPPLTGDHIRISQHLRGKWIIEIPEMSAMGRADVRNLKAFITRREEIYTPKYGRNEVKEPRQCVFAGTTNDDTYLRDETGDRRFWPVKATIINLDAITQDRNQLWAEAVHLYRKGTRWWPDREFERTEIKPQQDQRYEDDVWTEAVAEFLDKQENGATILGIARGAVNADIAKLRTADQRRIIAILKRLGWRRPRGNLGRGPHGERYFYPEESAARIENQTHLAAFRQCVR